MTKNFFRSVKEGAMEMRTGFRFHELWMLLGWNEVRKKYRRSYIGPFWNSINTAVLVLFLGTLYTEIFNQDPKFYIPHLLLGWLGWIFFSQIILEGCHLFANMRAFILESDLPFSVLVYTLMFKHLILLFFNVLVFLCIAPFTEVKFQYFIVSLAGITLLVVNTFWIGFLAAIVSARYHDFIELVGNAFRILFFITPIIWIPGMEGRLHFLLNVNPAYHFIEIFRGPLMGNPISTASWIVSIVSAIFGWLVTLQFYNSHKNRIAFWV